MDNYTNKSCGNCRYFAEHYVRFFTRFIAMSQGHCLHSKMHNKHVMDKNQLNPNCDKWEQRVEKTREEKNNTIKEILLNIQRTITAIATNIESDNI